METQKSGIGGQRIDLDPPEVGILYLKEAGYVIGNTFTTPPGKLFVDLMNRSPEEVGIQTEKEIEPVTVFLFASFQ